MIYPVQAGLVLSVEMNMRAVAVDLTLAPYAGAGGEVAFVANPGRSCHLSLAVIFGQQQWLGCPWTAELGYSISRAPQP